MEINPNGASLSLTPEQEKQASRLRANIARVEAKRANIRKRTAGHYSRTVRDGAFQGMEDMDILLAAYRRDLAEIEVSA